MRLSFFGAAREVTGSCVRVEVADAEGKARQMLIDCGLFQGEQAAAGKNGEPFGFDPKALNAVFVTHAHADHTGRLPKLIKEGYAGAFYMTEPTLALTRLVLEDAFQIMQQEAEESGAPLLYSKEDLESALANMRPVNYHQAIEFAQGISVMFHDAGHILGSAYISVEAEGKRVIFSGDIGNNDVPILPETEPISRADAVVCESTYGDRLHESAEERSTKLRAAIEQTVKNRGVLLIPAFSIERTQELLYEIHLLLERFKTNVPIYLDSPMAIRATQAYRHFKQFLQFDAPIFGEQGHDFFSFPNLRETLTIDESKVINDAKRPKIIIAGSGMMTGGRILHHLSRYVNQKFAMILIIGFQAAGTLGRRIFNKEPQVTIFGQRFDLRATVKAIGAFSAHGDQAKLARWLHPDEGPVPKKVLLVHGDWGVQEAFAEHLRTALAGSEITIPEAGKMYEI